MEAHRVGIEGASRLRTFHTTSTYRSASGGRSIRRLLCPRHGAKLFAGAKRHVVAQRFVPAKA